MATPKYHGIDSLYAQNLRPASTKRRGINSVEIGIGILDSLIELEQPSTLKEVADSVDMDPSQAHRYLTSLINSGLVYQNKVSGRYDVGHKAVALGVAALSQLDPLLDVSACARQLSTETSHTVLLSVWSDAGPVIVDWFPGRPPLYTTLAIGSLLPLTQSATGQIFMTYLKDEYLNDLLKNEEWQAPLSANSELVEICRNIRKQRLATVDSTVAPGLRAWASPVFASNQSIIACLTIVTSEAVPVKAQSGIVKTLTHTCEELSKNLGGSIPR